VKKVSLLWPIDDPANLSFTRRTIVRSLRASGAELVYEDRGTVLPEPGKIMWRFVPDARTVLELFCYPRQIVVVVHRSPDKFCRLEDWAGYWVLVKALEKAAQLVVWDKTTFQDLIRLGFHPSHVSFVPHPVDHRFFHPAPLGNTILCPGNHMRDEEVVGAIQKAGIAQVVRCTTHRGILLYHRRQRTGVEVYCCKSMSDVLKLYHRSKIVILPVVPDIIPAGITSMLEAMACARVVIAPRCKAAAGNMQDGVNGVILSGHSPNEWIECIKNLWNDERRLQEMGRLARNWVCARHTISKTGEAWARVWERCLPDISSAR